LDKIVPYALTYPWIGDLVVIATSKGFPSVLAYI